MIDDDDRTLSTRSGSEPSRPCSVQSHKQNKNNNYNIAHTRALSTTTSILLPM